MSEEKREIVQRAEQVPDPIQRVLLPAIEEVIRKNPTPETLAQLLAIQKEAWAMQAKLSYTAAITALKRDLPAWVERDATVDYQGGKGRVRYTHTSLAGLMTSVQPALVAHGFSLTWTPATGKDGVSVTATLTHRDGHSESATLTAPPDASGAKSSAQAIASTITLLSRYSAQAILGIASGDMKETGDEPPQGGDAAKVDSARNMRAIAGIVKAGKTKEEAERMAGRPVAEWTTEDLDKLREWMTPPEDPKPETANEVPKAEEKKPPPPARPINNGEMKEIKEWMRRYEITPIQFAGLLENETGRRPETAKDVDARQFAILKGKFDRLAKLDGSIDFNRNTMKFSEPQPPEKTPEQLQAEAVQEGLPF